MCVHGAGTQLLSTTIGAKEYVESEFTKVEADVILPNKDLFPSAITLPDFLWAFGMLRSRAFSRLRGENLALVPLADLVRSSLFQVIQLDETYNLLNIITEILVSLCGPYIDLPKIILPLSSHK